MPKFRIVYHTAGGNFRRELEAADAAQAEAAAWATLTQDPVRYDSDKTAILIRPAFIAAISIESEPIAQGDRRTGLLGSRSV